MKFYLPMRPNPNYAVSFLSAGALMRAGPALGRRSSFLAFAAVVCSALFVVVSCAGGSALRGLAQTGARPEPLHAAPA